MSHQDVVLLAMAKKPNIVRELEKETSHRNIQNSAYQDANKL